MIISGINDNYIYGALGILVIWFLVLSILLVKTILHYRHLVGTTKKQDLKNILETILHKIQRVENTTKILNKRCEEIEKNGQDHLQKLGFLRFNPFSDTGGDQSFVLSFLDGKDNGIVLSSLHSRGTTRLYAKAVKKSEGETLKLSKEEKETIEKAKKRRI